MTVDGLILENLIRELICREFKGMINESTKNADEIERIKQSMMIESSKLLDTSTRLKRLNDDFLQQRINERHYWAKKTDL